MRPSASFPRILVRSLSVSVHDIRIGRWVIAALGVTVAAATDARAHGAISERIEILTEFVRQHPAEGSAWVQLASAHCEHEEWQQALVELDRADQLAPGKFPTDLVRGEAYLMAGKTNQAQLALDRFLAAHPDSPRGLLARARVFKAEKNGIASLADYRAALAATAHPEPDLVQEAADALAANERTDEAVEVLSKGIEQLGPIPSLATRALELETATGRFDAALARIDALEQSAPRPEPWMAKRARVLAQAGRAAEARVAWQALRVHLAALPNLQRGSHAMSLLAEEAEKALAGQPTEAVSAEDLHKRIIPISPGATYEEELHRASDQIAAHPNDSIRWLHRAQVLLLSHDPAGALRDCDEVERLAPGRHETAVIRGPALAAVGRVEEGRACLDQFLATNPTNATALISRARIALASSRPEAALSDYRAVLATSANPSVEQTLEAVDLVTKAGSPEEARAGLDRALKRLGPNVQLTRTAFEIDVAQGHFASALECVAVLQQAAPRPEPWMARRAALLSQAGRNEAARLVWIALRDRIAALPNLQRGTPDLRALTAQAETALRALALSTPTHVASSSTVRP